MSTDINPVVALLGLVTALCTGGFFNVLLSAMTGRRSKKVDELEKFGKMQQEFRDEVRTENAKLNLKIDNIEKAVIKLANIFDDVSPRIEGLTITERTELRDAMDLVRLAV